jgi:hypothetical protein
MLCSLHSVEERIECVEARLDPAEHPDDGEIHSMSPDTGIPQPSHRRSAIDPSGRVAA